MAVTVLAFGAFGAAFGMWQVALPDIAQALRLSPGSLGAALSLGFAASLPAMIVAGRATDRWGARRATAVAAVWFAGSMAAIGAVGDAAAFVLVALSFFAASGMYDVAINAGAMRAEEHLRRDVMTHAHAAFSGSAAAGAVVAGVALGAGVPFRWLYVLAALLAVAVALRVAASTPDPVRRRAARDASSTAVRKRSALVLLATITAVAFLCEGAMENWSAIYLRSALDLSAALGASGVAVFHAAMLVGRLGAGRLLRRFTRPVVLRAAGALAAAGAVVALATDVAAVTLFGFLIVGLSLAAVAPIAFSLAGRLVPGDRGRATATLTTLGYGGFLIGPALVGGLADLVGLRLALGVIVVGGGLILIGAVRVRDVSAEPSEAVAV